jgi:signal transduction histidine kinase/ligand-binding sensor domain-containing protein
MSSTNSSFFTKGLLLFVSFLFVSCFQKEAPPFPYGDKFTVSPTTKSLGNGQKDTLNWEKRKTSPYVDLPTKKFSWDKLESQKLELGFPYKADLPLPEIPLNFDSLPYVDFSTDNFDKMPLSVRTIVLGEPEIRETSDLVVSPVATRGVQTLDENFGIPGDPQSSKLLSDGSLLIGTTSGYLVRYEGNKLEIYGPDQGVDAGSILSTLEDSKGRIWAGSNRGTVLVIDRKAGLIHELKSPGLIYRIFELFEMEDGTVWFRNDLPGYSYVDFDNKTLTILEGTNGAFGAFPIAAIEDHNGLIWMTTMDGIRILDRDLNRLYKMRSDAGLIANQIYNVYEDDKNRIWVSTASGINIISSDRKKMESMSPEQGLDGMNEIYEVYQENPNVFWLGTGNGILFRFDEISGMLEKYMISVGNQNILFEIFSDIQGQIWATSVQGGMYVVDRSTGRPASIDEADGFIENQVWSTIPDGEGNIWIGANEGIVRYSPSTRVLKKFNEEIGLTGNRTSSMLLDSNGRIWANGNRNGVSIIDPKEETIKQMESQAHLGGCIIRYILEDSDGSVWMSGNNGCILKYDMESSEISFILDSTNASANGSMLKDKEGKIWVATEGSGLHRIDPETNIRERFTVDNGLVSNQIFAVDDDDEGNIWICGDRGVERIDSQNMEISLFTKAQGLGANDVYDVMEHNKKIYTGTSRGVSVLNPQSEEEDLWDVYNIGKDQGMIEFDISQNSFSFDEQDRLWAGSNGLMLTVIDPFERDTVHHPASISNLNILDEPQQFFDSEYKASAVEGIDSIWISERAGYRLMTSAEIDSMKTSKSNVSWNGIESNALPIDLTLSHDQNFLSFNYSGGQFKNKEALVFSYILVGIDKAWSPITSDTKSENYRDLPPGNYAFKVAAKGYNNIWSDPAEFSFTILPPWWKTRWAYGLYILLFGSAVYAFVQYRSRWLKRENRLLEERVNHRTAQLKKTIEELETTQGQLIQSEKMASLGELTAGIAHEIQNPMNFINNFSEVSHELLDEMMEEIDKGDMEEAKEISSDIKQNLEKISHHGHRASSIVRGMLEHSRNSSGQKEDIDINVLADEYLRLAYHGLRAKDKSFNAKFETDFDDSIGKIEIIPQDIGRVMLNLINNAFYAVSDRNDQEENEDYQPTVKVTTKKLKDQVKITVEDNGSGIPKEIKDKIFQPFFTTKPSGKGTGLGLSLTYDIITQGHGGALELDSEVGQGTVFTIFLPVKN